MKKLKKVIIPAAGLGTRMLPATKVIQKEMLPLAGKPIIHYIVNEAIKAGFTEIILVTNENKISSESYFETSFELETALSKISNKTLLKEMREISNLKAKIINVKQNKPKGLGHAILTAESLILDEPFAVILPDMIIDSNYNLKNLALMKKNFEKTQVSSILLGKCKKSETQNYGIVKVKNKNSKNNFLEINDVIEKPNPKKAPSNLFVAGRYVFSNEILRYLNKEKPDLSGEIQLTGALYNFLKDSKTLKGLLLEGDIHDCGNKLGYLIANLAFSFKDKKIKREVLKFIK